MRFFGAEQERTAPVRGMEPVYERPVPPPFSQGDIRHRATCIGATGSRPAHEDGKL